MKVKKSAIIGEYMIDVKENNSIEVFRVYDNTKGALREVAEQEGFEYDPNWNTRQFGAKLCKQFGDGRQATQGCYNIYILDTETVKVYRTYDNTKGALREIAEKIGFEVDPKWNTQQFGSKLVDFINGKGKGTIAIAQIDTEKAKADAEEIDTASVDKAKAEVAAAQAELERLKADAAAAKSEAEKAKADAEAAAKAKAEAEKAKAEVDRMAAESAAAKAAADKAKAELERIKAETAKAQAEAEEAKAVLESAKKEAEAAQAATHVAKVIPGALPGLFSVGENKKVRFSKGNLQFHPKKYEFRFAEHQWDTVGEDNEKISPTYDGWIDLFGHGTSGYMGCQPYECSKDNKQYPTGSIAGTNYDWGIYNAISNGGTKEGLWRIITEAEFKYLWEKRPNANKLHAKATVNGVEGIVLLPDDFFERRVRVPYDATPFGYSSNTYDIETWKILEEAGAVFFPKNYYRSGNSLKCGKDMSIHYGDAGYRTDSYAVFKLFYDNRYYWDSSENYEGHFVRLVQDVK